MSADENRDVVLSRIMPASLLEDIRADNYSSCYIYLRYVQNFLDSKIAKGKDKITKQYLRFNHRQVPCRYILTDCTFSNYR